MEQPLPSSDTVDLARVARLVRPFETLELHAAGRLGGGWTIGYGHVQSARSGAQVSREEADALLLYDLGRVANVVRSAIYAPIHRNQLEALTAFAFHIGTENFLQSTTLQRFNAGDSLGAAQEIERWCCADLGGEAQVVDALVRRRAAEKAHFLTPPGGFPKASRARLRPQFEASAPKSTVEQSDVAASAALAAAHTVSARLRALVPDVADEAQAPSSIVETAPQPEPEPEALSHPNAPEPVETVRHELEGPAVAWVVAEAPAGLEAFTPPEAEVPPPPMPFENAPLEDAPPADRSDPVPEPAREPSIDEAWAASARAQARADDPFAQIPLDAAPIASLFRAKSEHRVQIPPRPEPADGTSAPRPLWRKAPLLWLWGCLALGLAIFIWAIWSICTTNPGAFNVVAILAGLVAIAAMAVPAYLLLGAKSAAAKSPISR